MGFYKFKDFLWYVSSAIVNFFCFKSVRKLLKFLLFLFLVIFLTSTILIKQSYAMSWGEATGGGFREGTPEQAELLTDLRQVYNYFENNNITLDRYVIEYVYDTSNNTDQVNIIGLESNATCYIHADWQGIFRFVTNYVYYFSFDRSSHMIYQANNLSSTPYDYFKASNIINNNFNINFQNGSLAISSNPLPYKKAPYITNSTSEIQAWDFQNLTIKSGGYTYNTNIYLKSYYSVNGSDYNVINNILLNVDSPYITEYDPFGYYTANIPITDLFTTNTLRQGNYIGFTLEFDGQAVSYGAYELTTTAQQTEDNQSNKEIQAIQNQTTAINNQTQVIEQQTDAINNQTQAITSTDYDEQQANQDFGDLGSNFTTTDVSNLDQLFSVLYNAFCTNEVVSVNLTIPFVNKSVTISSANISAFYPAQLVTIVNLFVWGIIGLFIIKDIRGMINKILEGNIENTSSDVKKEVL